MALTQEQINELNKKYAGTTSSMGTVATADQVKAQDTRLSSDEAYRTSELARANKVIEERKAQGLDTTAQTNYLNKINSMTPKTTAPTAPSLQDQLVAAQRQATIASLEKARSSSLNALGEEERKVAPAYQAQRTQADVTSNLQAKQFAEFMAQRGLNSSGGASLGETQRLGALQGGLSNLRAQELDTLQNINLRRTGIEQGYQSDIASAEANIQAQALQNAIAQMNADRSFGLQEAGLTGQYNGGQTLAAQGQQFNQGLQTEQLGLQKQNQTFSQDMATKQFDESVNQFNQQFGLNLRQQSFSEAQTAIQNAISRGNLSVAQGNLALRQAESIAQNDPNSYDNQIKKLQLEGVGLNNQNQLLQNQALQNQINTPASADVKPYTSIIEQRFMSKDDNGAPVFNEQGVRAYLEALSASNVDDATVLKIASLYGIQPIQEYNTDTYRLNN